MQHQHELPRPQWVPALSQMVQVLGRGSTLVLLCTAFLLLAISISQLVISLAGGGDRLVIALSVGASALGLSALLGYPLVSLLTHLDHSERDLSRLATLDPLTGVLNRRHFISLLEREWSLARRHEREYAIVLIDVDHFKRINDGFGHVCGDNVLREIARAAGETLRQADVLARFSGQEFALFLPHTDPLGALDAAERIREKVRALSFDWSNCPVPLSVSIGVAAMHREHLTLDQLIHDADVALELAKCDGRNCVRAAEQLPPPGKARSEAARRNP